MTALEEGGHGPAVSTVDVTRNQMGLLEVAAVAHGHEVRLIVDTGANATVLDTASAERLGIGGRRERAESVRCVTDSAEIGYVDTFEIGEVMLSDHRVAVLDLGPVLQRLSGGHAPSADGILGSDVLSAVSAVIDYGTNQMRISSPPPTPARSAGTG